jgi:hypothetical protein
MSDLPQCGFLALCPFLKMPDQKYHIYLPYKISYWSRDMFVPT